MRKNPGIPGFLLVLLQCCQPMFGQEIKIPADTTQLVAVETKDGNEYVGFVTGMDSVFIRLKTESLGALQLRRQDIRQLQPLSRVQLVDGKYWFENPSSTRYFFGPNGYGLRKGEGYYQNTWVLFNQVSYGLSNHFTIGVGIVPLFFFDGTSSPVWITPKVSIPIKKDQINLGLGGLFAYVLGEENGSFGVAYGQMTFGSRDRNINVGLGYGYAGDSWANTPTVSLSGMYRTGKKFALLTENYVFDTGDENLILCSFGGRFIGRRISVDAGLVVPVVLEEGFLAVPWLGLSVPFGKPASY
ncbi:MAG: hypothetical protein IT260_22460 [Saprospiraceae bacterium]|nr:hypothetical protein [Saprospiraceae bacterium]